MKPSERAAEAIFDDYTRYNWDAFERSDVEEDLAKIIARETRCDEMVELLGEWSNSKPAKERGRNEPKGA